jgi:hypothetical protein
MKGGPSVLEDAGWGAGLSAAQVASLAGVSKPTVLRALKRHGIPARPRTGTAGTQIDNDERNGTT